ncbi:bifunctional precorrin-2 dehydrogenase/sirohydrochlorin ferrochelatase [bacterium]|nr:bifunctional precorrin-2 dehydrogenase/sirohydrochlorin ferrochelatase [bacterium]
MYLPLIHRGDRTRALVVGGGAIAKRKVQDLLDAGASVSVISPEWNPGLRSLLDSKSLQNETRPYQSGDIEGYNLIIVATDDETVNRQVSEEARERGIPVNVVDQPDLCTVYFAAVVRRPPLTIAISTGGAAPFFAREMKKSLANWVDQGWDTRAEWAKLIRAWALKHVESSEEREALFARFMALPSDRLMQWKLDDPPVQLWQEWSRKEEA